MLKTEQLLGPNLLLIWVPGHMNFTGNEEIKNINNYENELPLIPAGTYSLRNKYVTLSTDLK